MGLEARMKEVIDLAESAQHDPHTQSPDQIDAHKRTSAPKWRRPSHNTERRELSRVAKEEKIPLKHLVTAFKAAKLKPLHPKTWSKLQNTDSQDTKTVGD